MHWERPFPHFFWVMRRVFKCDDMASSLNPKKQKQERRLVVILALEFSCSERSLLLTDTFAAIIDETTAALLNKHGSLWRESRLYIISVFQERRWDYERRQAVNPDEDNEVSCSWHVKTKGSPPPSHPPRHWSTSRHSEYVIIHWSLQFFIDASLFLLECLQLCHLCETRWSCVNTSQTKGQSWSNQEKINSADSLVASTNPP